MAVPVIMRRRRQEVGGPNWTPLRLTSLGAWYSGASLLPQSAAALTDWNDEGPNNYDLPTDVNTPAVVACGSSFAGEFIRSGTAANSEYVHASGLTITASTAGYMWGVFALRSGASTAGFHTIFSIGAATLGSRFLELDLHPVGGTALHPGLYNSNNANPSNAFARSTTAIADTNWHTLLVEGDSVANTYRIWQDGTEVGSPVTGTSGGAVGDWLGTWTGTVPSRMAIGIGIRNGTVAEGGDVKVFDCGFGHGTLGSDLSYLLSHLSRKQAAAT